MKPTFARSFILVLRAAILAAVVATSWATEFAFTHPGLLHSREDLDRMKAAVAAKQEPIFSGYEKFRAHPASQATYAMRGPAEEIGRSPSVKFGEFDADANAAYQCALMWCLTGERAYADKAKQIVNAWSANLRRVSGADAVLMAGLGPFKLINAAELLRSADAGWTDADIRQAARMFREAIYPTLKDFALFANGNWDTAAIKTVLAIGVFCDDREMFERALRYYVDGAGDGRLTHYIINAEGQCQESGRDMPHTQLGLAHLGDCCEIAWHQGLDLYGYADNRLLHGFEYTARYNLGESVPFVETLDRTGKYHHTVIATMGRGNLRPVFEQIYNHYVNRVGLAAPSTQRAAEKLRPEGAGPGADQPGFGTLLFSRPPSTGAVVTPLHAPAAPGALVAHGSSTGNTLTWVAAIGAADYTVKRADSPGGPYRVVARSVKATTYRDATVIAGHVYSYVVSAANASGESPDAFVASICSGLPAPWRSADIGPVAVSGDTGFDGHTFTIEGAGTSIGGTDDQFQFLHAPLTGDGVIIARFVPQVSSQFSQFGVMMRDSLAAASAHASLLFTADHSRETERPGWRVQLLTRSASGAATTVAGTSEPLAAPFVTYGRLMQPYWLRLARTGDTFAAAISSDGKTWTPVASAAVPLKNEIFVGLPACSRLASVTTTVMFDHVSAPGWTTSP